MKNAAGNMNGGPIIIGGGPILGQPQQQQQEQQGNRYKTELCRPFSEYRLCKYGDKCQFAHGLPELRRTPRHPKYKTELCKTYHTHGLCPYGHRCHFVHNNEEQRNNEQLPHEQMYVRSPSQSDDSGNNTDDSNSSPTLTYRLPIFTSDLFTS